MKMKKFKNYIWDFDGTLFDTYPVMLQALNEAIKKFDVQFDGDLAYFIRNYSIKEFAEKYGSPAFYDYYHEREHALNQNPQIYPEMPRILCDIVSQAGQNFVLSHRDKTTYTHLQGLEELFTEIVTAEQDFARKPDPEAIHYLLNKYQLNPLETVMVGDRPLDVEAGRNAGISSLLFDEFDYFDDQIADFRIRKWSNLK